MSVIVVLTREPPADDELVARVGDRARCLLVPLAATHYADPATVEAEIAAAAGAGTFAGVAVTSARAARFVPLGLAHAAPGAVVGAVGPETAAAVRAATGDPPPVILVPERPSAAALAALVPAGPVLWLAGRTRRPDLVDGLGARGLAVSVVECYSVETLALDGLAKEEINLGEVVVIASPEAWARAREHVRTNAWVLAIGETTAAAVRKDRAHVEVAGDSLADSLLALVDRLDRGEVGGSQ